MRIESMIRTDLLEEISSAPAPSAVDLPAALFWFQPLNDDFFSPSVLPSKPKQQLY